MEQQPTIKEIIQARTIEKLSKQLNEKSVLLAEAEAKSDLYRELLEQREEQVKQFEVQAEESKKKTEESIKAKETESTPPSIAEETGNTPEDTRDWFDINDQ